jgi:hypothetical protein
MSTVTKEKKQEVRWLQDRIRSYEGRLIEPWERRLSRMYRQRLYRLTQTKTALVS